jgi:3-mercaptopyruvate sulfurtransferase SseA
LEVAQLAPDQAHPVVVTGSGNLSALLAAATLQSMGYTRVSALDGGVRAWREAGRPLEQGLSGIMRPPVDIVPAGTDRTYADMIHYLTWEEALGSKYAQSV